MATNRAAKLDSLKRINGILKEGYAEIFKDMTEYTTVQCGACRCNFFFCHTFEVPKIDYGVISDAHGPVEGYQSRFPCPKCRVLLRIDEDEIELRAWAKPDSQHS